MTLSRLKDLIVSIFIYTFLLCHIFLFCLHHNDYNLPVFTPTACQISAKHLVCHVLPLTQIQTIQLDLKAFLLVKGKTDIVQLTSNYHS